MKHSMCFFHNTLVFLFISANDIFAAPTFIGKHLKSIFQKSTYIMTVAQLRNALDYVNHSREKRTEMGLLVSNNPQLIEPLLQLAFEDKSHISSKACWVMEFAAKQKLSYIFPHLDAFTTAIGTLKRDSSVRPMAKICEYLMIAYFKKPLDTTLRHVLTVEHQEKITTACFDWLIGAHKVATQAYAMTCLLLLGRNFKWIHPELKIILEQNYHKGSAAYKARARKTLEKIN